MLCGRCRLLAICTPAVVMLWSSCCAGVCAHPRDRLPALLPGHDAGAEEANHVCGRRRHGGCKTAAHIAAYYSWGAGRSGTWKLGALPISHLTPCITHSCLYSLPAWLQGKTQLVKGKLQGLPEDLSSLTINLNYFSDVASFQKVGGRRGWRWQEWCVGGSGTVRPACSCTVSTCLHDRCKDWQRCLHPPCTLLPSLPPSSHTAPATHHALPPCLPCPLPLTPRRP